MKSRFRTPFGAIFWNEVLLNSKRVAPYALMILFSVAALLGWARGPAVALGWATNSDFYIARGLKAFSFLFGLPIFNALIMGDPVIRDFRLEIDPLIFSKPFSRAQYLLGKFFGNFFVLVCCAAAFPLTQFVLQAFRPSQMVVQSVQVLPYLKHFFFFVLITHLALAAFYFAVGTLTRSSKIVYGLAACFYPIYAAYGLLLLSPLSVRWRSFLDIFLLGTGPSNNGFGNSADYLNRYIYSYTPDMIWNRMFLILVAAGCLTWLYLRFTTAERSTGKNSLAGVSLGLSPATEIVSYDSESFQETRRERNEKAVLSQPVKTKSSALLPSITTPTGIGSQLPQLFAALVVEFRLLLSERSLVVIMPLATFLSILEVAFYDIPADVSISAAYATNTAKLLLLFLIGMTVFYTGEAMHRDREVRVESVIWATPAPNSVLLLSKFLAVLTLTVSLILLVGLAAIIIQLLRGHTPVDISAYLIVYSVILFPSIVFMIGAALVLNVLLPDKYVVYALSIGTGVGLVYLYSQGPNHWLYNPVLYNLWRYSDLTGPTLNRILLHRLFCLAQAGVFLATAHLAFRRRMERGLWTNGRLTNTGWTLLLTAVCVGVSVACGIVMSGWK